MTPSRIVFIKSGSFSHTNESVGRMLQEAFPGYGLDVIDTFDVIRSHRLTAARNIYAALSEHGMRMLAGRKRFWSGFFSSTFMFHRVQQWLTEAIRAEDYAFSFQTQSMGFDARVPGLPHFVYTDDTRRAPRLFDPHADILWSDARLALEREVYRAATAVFTMGSHIRRSVIEQYGGDPARVFCVGAGCNVPDPGETRPPYERRNVLFVGVEWERKGGPELVSAFRRVLQVHPDASLTIVGCSPAVDVPNCHVVGRVSREEVARYFRNASVFCLPTRAEPFGIAVVEAQMYRLPVVGTNTHAVPDIIVHGENGYLTRPGDAEALARALIDLLNDPGRCRTFGRHGYESASRRFTWRAVGARMKAVIEPALRERSQAGVRGRAGQRQHSAF